ncbi:hypothetical protein [Mycobacterium sp. SM1]|uniref:hypothetical protein n=1 Tax=Mycobacterium sp. SM1 TaxID=2816243 RepID=UPI0027DC8865|nr:hypothetical protein [Mycobacterium sp. SM1]
MLLDSYGPTVRGSVNVAAVADYAGVSASTVRRWISRRHSPSRRLAIPKQRITQLQRGPAEVERRNEQQYQYALNAVEAINDERSILPSWREQGWLNPHTVAIMEIHGKPWRQVAVTNASRRALGELRRRGKIVAKLTLPTRFHAQVLAHAVMTRQLAWRVHPTVQRLSAGRTQVWMADAPPVDLAALANKLGFQSTGTLVSVQHRPSRDKRPDQHRRDQPRLPQPNRFTTSTTRPQPVVRHTTHVHM